MLSRTPLFVIGSCVVAASVLSGQVAVAQAARVELGTVDTADDELAVIVSETDGVGLLTVSAVREDGNTFNIAEERVGAGTYYLPFLRKLPAGRFVSIHTDWVPQETAGAP